MARRVTPCSQDDELAHELKTAIAAMLALVSATVLPMAGLHRASTACWRGSGGILLATVACANVVRTVAVLAA